MKVLLRKTETGCYYVERDQWTTDPKQARDFDEVASAIQRHQEEHLTGMEVMLYFDDPLHDPVLPLRSFA